MGSNPTPSARYPIVQPGILETELISALNYPSIWDGALIPCSHSTSYYVRYNVDSTGENDET